METKSCKSIALANAADPAELVLDNAAALDDDGWALIAPFGRHPKTRVFTDAGQVKEQQFIQVLDNESADAMVGKENSFFSKLKRALVGIPVFKGHGDLKDHDPKALGNEQKIKLGVVDQIRKSERGIEAHFALDNDGAAAVAAGWKLPSALWLVLPIGNEVQANGQNAILARPFKLISVALTQFPNIPGVESLANQAGPGPTVKPAGPGPTVPTATINQNETMLHEQIVGLLIGKKVALSNAAPDSEIIAKLANAEFPPDAATPEGKAARAAHLASAGANDKASHLAAAAAHAKASDAHEEAGNKKHAAAHDAMADAHADSAKKCD